jgi:DMSO reductase anchor subunit
MMLTLTQLSVGAFTIAYVADKIALAPMEGRLAQTAYACVTALIALGASVFHLGRPLLAYRAVLGLRTSWLSREALTFGLYAQLAILYGLLVAGQSLPAFPGKEQLIAAAPAVRVGAVSFGLLGVFCSVMVYVVTRREQWSFTQTGIKFFSSTLLLGCASVATVSVWGRGAEADSPSRLLSAIVAIALLKLAFEAHTLGYASDRRTTALKRMAMVMRGELLAVTVTRFSLLLFGGIALPAALLSNLLPAGAPTATTVAMLLALLMGELSERYLFFRAAPASRMPGGLK